MSRAWLAFTLVVVAATYSPQLFSPFELQDDHRIIAPSIRPHGGVLHDYVLAIRDDFTEVGRFRPVNQVFDVVGPRLLGPAPLLWHALSLLLVIGVSGLLFSVGERLFDTPLAGAVLALVTIMAPDPGPTATWYRLGPKEAWGMLFISAALLLMVSRAGQAITFTFVILAAYSKESFLLTIPALMMLRVWLERRTGLSLRTSLHRLRGVLAGYALVFAVGVVCVLMAVSTAGARSYGGQSAGRSPDAILDVLGRDLWRAPSLAVWFIPVILALKVRSPGLLPSAACAAWIIPQYLLHATRGGFWDHYWLPCVLAFAAMNAAAINALRSRPRLFGAALLVCAVWLVNAFRIDFLAVVNHTEKARVQQEAVRIAARAVGDRGDLVVIADPKEQSETAPSFADFVRFNGARAGRVWILDPGAVNKLPGGTAAIVYLDEDSAGVPVPLGFSPRHAQGRRRYLSLRRRDLHVIPFSVRVDVVEN